MPLPTQTFNTIAEWENWVNTNIIPNGNEEITGDDGNITENAAVKFIKRSPLNWEKAQIIQTSGTSYATRPIIVFISNTPSEFTFGDNIYNEYVFINTLYDNIPLASGIAYVDINLSPVDNIPAKSIVNICKANNDLWIVSSVPSSGSLSSLPPLIGIVDGGNTDDPVSGTSIFQSDKLINLGASNQGKIQIQIDNGILSNYGLNISFDFDSPNGIIDLNYNGSGNEWQSGSSLYIDLNQK